MSLGGLIFLFFSWQHIETISQCLFGAKLSLYGAVKSDLEAVHCIVLEASWSFSVTVILKLFGIY